MRSKALSFTLTLIAVLTVCASLSATTFEITAKTPSGNDAIKQRCIGELVDFILNSEHWKEFETEFDRRIKESRPDLHKGWRRTHHFDCVQEGSNCRIKIDPIEKSELLIIISFDILTDHAANVLASKDKFVELLCKYYKEITITRNDRIIDERELELKPAVSSNSIQSLRSRL